MAQPGLSHPSEDLKRIGQRSIELARPLGPGLPGSESRMAQKLRGSASGGKRPAELRNNPSLDVQTPQRFPGRQLLLPSALFSASLGVASTRCTVNCTAGTYLMYLHPCMCSVCVCNDPSSPLLPSLERDEALCRRRGKAQPMQVRRWSTRPPPLAQLATSFSAILVLVLGRGCNDAVAVSNRGGQ